jgi:hypothetical protein
LLGDVAGGVEPCSGVNASQALGVDVEDVLLL